MGASGRLATQVLQYVGTSVKPGITTDEIDQAVHQILVDNGAYPSPLGYGGFPKSVCISVNECICHGDSHVLELLLVLDLSRHIFFISFAEKSFLVMQHWNRSRRDRR